MARISRTPEGEDWVGVMPKLGDKPRRPDRRGSPCRVRPRSSPQRQKPRAPCSPHHQPQPNQCSVFRRQPLLGERMPVCCRNCGEFSRRCCTTSLGERGWGLLSLGFGCKTCGKTAAGRRLRGLSDYFMPLDAPGKKAQLEACEHFRGHHLMKHTGSCVLRR